MIANDLQSIPEAETRTMPLESRCRVLPLGPRLPQRAWKTGNACVPIPSSRFAADSLRARNQRAFWRPRAAGIPKAAYRPSRELPVSCR
jgi:hypothetical protein